ncbi:UDP-N-acetylmuramoyl-tripeptide--D-alanyl-D-alanine ligase [Nocardioides sp. GCM10027113]|uniref:UDP-N-acetylmuramoyl-tripeptide--D-alanyl-D- alanine ligase n=1 Tax=unclassified Nocardioides TaxID=2615069 RepID=UPI00361E9F98
MIPMTLTEIAEVVEGRVAGDPATQVTGAAFVDSRSPVENGLFVAVIGEHVDGHEYAGDAVAHGAAAVLGSHDTGQPGVVVDDPVAALARLAGHVVDRLPATVLAMTGSQGKTGTKDYLAHVLEGFGPTVATRGNLNNEIGVPLTVLRADEQTAYLVVEMGARGVGHIAYLCDIARPDVAAVLNVGTAHLSEFGSREAIAQAKGEIVESLAPEGVAVLNAYDDFTPGMAARTRARVITFGGHDSDVAWRDPSADDLGRQSFTLGYDGEWFPVRLGQLGAHQVQNAMAATAMAVGAGLPLEQVAARLSTAAPASRWRMELHERPDGLVVINDAYNANPESMKAALGTLAGIGRSRDCRTLAVLGEMLELGDGAVDAHRDVGRFAAAEGVDVVVTVGEAASAIAEGARGHEGWTGEAIVTAGRDEALSWMRENVAAADVVLVKASRGAALEHIADGLLEGSTQ